MGLRPAEHQGLQDLLIKVGNRSMEQPWRFRRTDVGIDVFTNREHVRIGADDVRRLHLYFTARVRELDGG
jgi:hypothetical protein